MSNIKFSRSNRKGKKYKVTFIYNGEKHTKHFGAIGYEQYKDSTGLGLYSEYDHFDTKRRKNFRNHYLPLIGRIIICGKFN